MVLFTPFHHIVLANSSKPCTNEVLMDEDEKNEARQKTGRKNRREGKMKESSHSKERHGATEYERRIKRFSATSQNIPLQQESFVFQVRFIIW